MKKKNEKKVNGSGNGKERTAPVGEEKAIKPRKKRAKKEKTVKKPCLKYAFDTLNKGQSFTIENPQGMEGKVTRRENVRVLASEYGKRNNMRFEVSKIEGTKCTVTRLS